MVEVSLTVGKLDASLALLLTKDHHLIEFPTILLPDGVNAGSVITIKCEQDVQQEQQEREKFEETQERILQLFGTHEPEKPSLSLKNVTQTSAVLEWTPLSLGSASIKSLTLFKDGERLGQIPNALVQTTTKLSGLQIDTKYDFYLKLDTTAGVYESEHLAVQTHKMTDLSGITVCVGDLDPTDCEMDAIELALKKIGAKPLQREVHVDTTHFVTTRGLGDEWKRASNLNIPIVRPEWLKACEIERRIVGVRNFYLDADPKLYEKYVMVKGDETATPVEAPVEEPVEASQQPKEDTAVDNGDVNGSVEQTAETTENAEDVEANVIVTEGAPETPVAAEVETQAPDTIESEDAPETAEPAEPKESVETREQVEPAVETEAQENDVEPVELPVDDTTVESTNPLAEASLSTEPTDDVIEVIPEASEVREEPPVEESILESEPEPETVEPTEPVSEVTDSVVDEPKIEVSETADAQSDPEVDTALANDEFDDVDINQDVEEDEETTAASATTQSPKKKNKKKKKGKK